MQPDLTLLYARARALRARRARNAADFVAAVGPAPRPLTRGVLQDDAPLAQDLDQHALLLDEEEAREAAVRQAEERLCQDCGADLTALEERLRHRCSGCQEKRDEGSAWRSARLEPTPTGPLVGGKEGGR